MFYCWYRTKFRDLHLIKDEISFTVNSGPNMYNKVDWRAKYYAVFDNVSLYQIEEAINSHCEYDGIFTFNIDNIIKNKDKVVYLPTDFSCSYCLNTFWDKYFPNIFKSSAFSDDISKIIYSGATVVYTCIQIAVYMGFSEIYLLGVDCDYSNELKHAVISMNGEEMKYNQNEWLKTENKMIKQFTDLSKHLDPNIKVFNATRGGKLEAFPRVNLEYIMM